MLKQEYNMALNTIKEYENQPGIGK